MRVAEYQIGRIRPAICFSCIIGLLAMGSACNNGATSVNGTDGNSDSTGDENVLLTEALSYDGSLTGKVFETQTTRESADGTSAAQQAPVGFDPDQTEVEFHDLGGNQLVGPDGQTIDPAQLAGDGSFFADNLPVGTDFSICVDIGLDGNCDFETTVNIPSRDGGNVGELNDVRVDPLTTLIRAKLRKLLEERGIDPADLPISPVAIVKRIVDAYTHLFEESGIDHVLTLDDIASTSLDRLAELFDSLVPAGAQSGMKIVEGNLRMAKAGDVQQRALATAEVFLRAGFPIADEPGGLDMSFLGELDGVIVTSFDELFGDDGNPDEFDDFDDFDEFDEEGDEFDNGFEEIMSAEVDGDELLGDSPGQPVIYIDTTAEPDRNFANAEGDYESEDGEGPQLPVLHEHALVELTRLAESGKRLSLGQLYDALTSLTEGLGARLTYAVFDPLFAGPPLDVFQTADGKGKAINLDRLFRRFFDEGLHDVGPGEFERRQAEFRRMLTELLGDTVPPPFGRLFDGIVTDRIAGIGDLAERIRRARAHLPFNRSGPSAFFVVADGDSFNSDADVSAVTVDAQVDQDGAVESVVYNPDGDGRFYLTFTHRTDEDGTVEFLTRETGWLLHGRRGPVRQSIHDDSLFAPVNGSPFADFVSKTGAFYPGVDMPVIRADFRPEPAGQDVPGPQERIFVLATRHGRHAEPLRMDYDHVTEQTVYNPWGRHLLMFLPESQETGQFALFNEGTGRLARTDDPSEFFDALPERPDHFEDFFNEFSDDQDLGQFDDIGDFVDEFLDGLPPDFLDGETDFTDEDLPPFDDPTDDDGTSETDGQDGDTQPEDRQVDPEGQDGETGQDEATGDDGTTDGQLPLDDGMDDDLIAPPPDHGNSDFIVISVRQIEGWDVEAITFTHVFGTEVPNEHYDADADPYYDDINDNDLHDENEPTAPYRPTLFDPRDWRSTDIRLYYRRVDDDASVTFEEVEFESDTPLTLDGVQLVPRRYKARPNAFRFSRPNTAINLLTAFLPPEFFDGTHSLDRDTRIDVFAAVAIINLVMDQIFNVEAEVDIDGLGPLPRQRQLHDAHLFIVPVDDPFVVIMKAIAHRLEANRT